MPPPPPPPPPICLPFFGGKKSRRRLTYSERSATEDYSSRRSSIDCLASGSYSPTATLTPHAEKLTFSSETESFNVNDYSDAARDVTPAHTTLKRSNTIATTKDKSNTGSKKWGYGWGIGKKAAKNQDDVSEKPHIRSPGSTPPPVYNSPLSETRSRATRSTQSHSSRSYSQTDWEQGHDTAHDTLHRARSVSTNGGFIHYIPPPSNPPPSNPKRSNTYKSNTTKASGRSGRPTLYPSESSSTLVGSALERKVRDEDPIAEKLDTRSRLDSLRDLVEAGGSTTNCKDWTEWIVNRAKDSKIGIDARLISYQAPTALNNALKPKNSKLQYPLRTLVDIVWRDKPARSREPIYVQPKEFTWEWIRQQRTGDTFPSQMQVATLVANLSSIAWLLNLRGDDIPFNPSSTPTCSSVLESATLFIEDAKLTEEVKGYLQSIGIVWRDYNEIWTFLRRKEWGEGNVIISPQTSYAISLMMTSFRYTVLPSHVEDMTAVKNDIEINGLHNAYLRDGAAYVRWLALIEQKVQQGYDITEYEAARKNKYYMSLAYENISATGPNAALPHYVPHKTTAKMIDRDTLTPSDDSGGQYCDGTCDTTRTVHFGRPTQDQCEAYTRVLQGHIAIDSAIFPEGMSGAKLDVLARRALWQDGLNYMHGTGHGFGSFLNVHEGPQSFSSDTVLVPGHVITNEPGFYNAGKWGMRIESALAVKRMKTKGQFNGDIWLGFERLTAVPIQTKMVREVMLSKEERQWLKDHNRRCLEQLEPFLREDKRAMRYLRREAERGIGIASAGPGGLTIDWD
ncbi:Creatinase aminopeptidase [Ganoderma leucocontextum]|nr:Creatinase aminopeptidase [Ganoderma leucocontextum]